MIQYLFVFRVGKILAISTAHGGYKMQWIKCSDRLPKPDIPVLCIDACIGKNCVLSLFDSSCDKYCWMDESGFYVRKKEITHWMPLPKPPEQYGMDQCRR
jgi:hypothetical protein